MVGLLYYIYVCVWRMIGYYDIDGIALSGTVQCRPDDDKRPLRGKEKHEKAERKKIKINIYTHTILYEKYTLVNRADIGSKSSLSLCRDNCFSVSPSFNSYIIQ